ncbi:MAG TPA: 50S ribosomal protein L23 [Methylomirabilota bacterium]|jgi:large subunit ribosomal protein L23|nr:50S ribosomal protein L23 [Methylomirabilota bacterium]
MAIFGLGKKEKEHKHSAKAKENVLDMVKEPTQEGTPKVSKENTGRAHRILRSHHLTEKTNQLSNTGRYVFKVSKTTNKIEVRKAVEQVYDVHVVSVNMINNPGKVRRQGRSFGRTSDWKKAIVTLKEGERITGLAEGV